MAIEPRQARDLRVGLLVLALGVAATSSHAEDHDLGYSRTGAYLVLGGVTAFEQFRQTGEQTTSNSLGFEIRGGYRFSRYLSLEASGAYLVGFETNVELSDLPRNPPLEDESLTIDGGLVTINGKAYYPFGRIQPYALAGMGTLWTAIRGGYNVNSVCQLDDRKWFCRRTYARLGDAAGFAVRFGGGVDFYVTRDWGLTLDATYVMPFGNLEQLRWVQLGWGARFNF